ncbi:MAG: 3-deoxy-D-manno-octulosonic acid transferase [Ignavibacteriales bacterium]|nr:MAG: 3-deoxy-D-manno-octulosonic acid transferase [Ignavibacteriales bacterium]
MQAVYRIIYNLLIPVIYLLFNAAALFNKKIRKGQKGRKRLFEELILNSARLDKTRPLLWFHSASLGEFEQAKPIIEELRKQNIYNILVTFFSPSGYDNSRKYKFADLISYIPFDTASSAERFITMTRPALAVIMRYDFWPNHIWELSRRNIPILIADATMKDGSKRGMPGLRSFHAALFRNFTRILTVSERDRENFRRFGCTDKQLALGGDTRFDRVYMRSLGAKEQNILRPEITAGKKVIVLGSSWEEDEEVMIPALLKLLKYHHDLFIIIAPHEPAIEHLEKLEADFTGHTTIRFSRQNSYAGERILLIDGIGLLLTLYSYADITFVGGSFKSNVHNVLEAAVYSVPVLYGPKIYNSQEAGRLASSGGGIIIRTKKDAYIQLSRLLNNDAARKERGRAAGEFVQSNLGATSNIISAIGEILNKNYEV